MLVSEWLPFHGWMGFPKVDARNGRLNAFTLAFNFTDDASEKWSSRFLRLQMGEGYAYVAARVLMLQAFPLLFERLNVDREDSAIAPALRSNETQVSKENYISKIARACANSVKSRYAGDLLKKNIHKPLREIVGTSNVIAELNKANYRSDRIESKNVFVFDDFIDRGETLSHIGQAILKSNPNATIWGIAFGKCLKHSWNPELNNNHVSKKWDDIWEQGEQLARTLEKKDLHEPPGSE